MQIRYKWKNLSKDWIKVGKSQRKVVYISLFHLVPDPAGNQKKLIKVIFENRLKKMADIWIRAKAGNSIYNGRVANVICIFGSLWIEDMPERESGCKKMNFEQFFRWLMKQFFITLICLFYLKSAIKPQFFFQLVCKIKTEYCL